jgi:thiamine biosynthesis lipoprotein
VKAKVMGNFEDQFEAMGSQIRILIGPPAEPGLPPADEAGERARAFIHDFDSRLSRFRPDSELCTLNRDPRGEVPASGLLRTAVKAGIWAARRTDGLVDPTLIGEVEAAGYRESRAGKAGTPVEQSLSGAPARRPARPSVPGRWREFSVDDDLAVVRRPAGLGFDTGGTGKGLAADLLAETLSGYSRFLISCGGDIRIGGREAPANPYEVQVEHPASGGRPHRFRLGSGGIATSGINARAWRRSDGSPAHHLIDPSTGEPCWSGLIGVTALGRTALESETMAKAALLSGPVEGRRVLGRHGGLLVHDDGRVEVVGAMSLSLRIPAMPARSAPGGQVAA